jgi:hypothetical protein
MSGCGQTKVISLLTIGPKMSQKILRLTIKLLLIQFIKMVVGSLEQIHKRGVLFVKNGRKVTITLTKYLFLFLVCCLNSAEKIFPSSKMEFILNANTFMKTPTMFLNDWNSVLVRNFKQKIQKCPVHVGLIETSVLTKFINLRYENKIKSYFSTSE